MAHIVSILLCSICLRTPHEFILLQTITGMASIYSLRELSQRSQLLRSALIVVITYTILYFALDLIHVNNIAQLNTYMYVNFIINGILLLFTYPLLFILEKTFGFTSNVTLVELSNINNKLMREMSEVAPGTFQHSLQLANLTAAAANRIGANSQLVRTGAMYHDIGKMLNPAFFTENQTGVNPHDQLNYKQSAQIVINHVTDGMKLAEKNDLPQVIKDFICTHHGQGLTKYFYISYQNEHPDEEVDKEAARLCKERSIPVNVVDNQELCDFIFPSIVQKGDMVAGFVTGGKSPHVAAKLRRDFEANVSDNIESILDYLSEVRTLAKEKIDDDRKRAAYIREVSEFCMKADRVCSNKEENAFLQKYLDNRSETVLPGAALVGAGCGSYELITIKGLNEIRRAEVIVYDDLIDEHLLEFAPESCELIYAGKRSGRHSKAQEEINELLVEKAIEGRYVVRLKGGDPYVFGRGGEEALALKEHGIPVHEVPGVTSSIGLCGMAGIPVTHRGASRGFHVITGHTADNLPPEIEEIRWKSYAKLDETFVFLMGLKSIDMITEKLMRYGKLSDTPVAVIHGENTDGTYVKFVGTLSDIAAKVKEVDFPSPAIIVVGEVASLELTD